MDKKQLREEIELLRTKIFNIENNTYYDEVKHLIDRFCELEMNEENKEELLDITEAYVKLAKKYIKINIVYNSEEDNMCKNCNYIMDENKTEGNSECPECGALNEFIDMNLYIKDFNNIPIYFDEELVNFTKLLDRYEGKIYQYKKEKLFPQLDKYFKELGYPNREEIKKRKLINGKREGTSAKMIFDALERTGNILLIDEVHSIGHNFWNWELPDCSLYREKILELHQRTQNCWLRIRDKFGKKSLGQHFRLYQEYNAVGFKIGVENFKIQDSLESKKIYNEAWRIICEECNIPYVYVA